MSLYGWILIGSFAGPFFLSFDKKVHFYTYWRHLLPAIFLVAVPFLIWDEYFTEKGIWGFGSPYIFNYYIGRLPIEEVLFFLIVPFACFFIYEVLRSYFPSIKINRTAHIFAFGWTLSGLVFGLFNMDNWYTASACLISSILTIGIYFVNRSNWFGSFVFAYFVSIIPFLIVNGILTGAVTSSPVVWYNSSHIMGFRIYTIPFEDLYYNFCLLLPIAALYEFFKKKFPAPSSQGQK